MNPADDIWAKVIELMKQQGLSPTTIKTWFDDAKAVSLTEDSFTISTPNDYTQSVIKSLYIPKIEAALKELFSMDLKVVVLTEKELENTSAAKQDILFPGTSDYTFERFVVGSSNRYAYSAARAVADIPGRAGYNPLFIYGESGLGKTHLLYAIAHTIHANHPDYKIVYIKGDTFTNELVAAIREGRNQQFREKYREADVFLMDDVQFIASKERTQEEFFHTFNALTQDGKQIVLSSDRPPKDMPQLEDRMRTRFEWGLLADVQPPDLETRMLIVKRKADALNFDISDDVVEYIAQKLKNNIRQLESAVKKMQAYVQIQGAHVNTATAQQAIRDILSDNKPIPVVVDKIITEVARTYGANPEDLRSKKKDAQTSKYRQISMYIVREVTGLSAKAIGAEFGGRHYSTVLYALDEIKKESDTDSALRTTINDIIKNVQES